MDFKQTVADYKNYLIETRRTVYGGNYDGYIARNILDAFCKLLMGFRHSKIKIKTDWHKIENGYLYKYHIYNGDKYQYNQFYLNEDFKLIKIEGDGQNIIRKVFEFIEYWDYDKFFEWSYKNFEIIYHIAYYWDCDDENQRNGNRFEKYIQLDEKTKNKYMALNSIHQNLINQSFDKIDIALDLMLPAWETHLFERGKYGERQKISGRYSTDDIPNIEILNLTEDDDNIIIFPNESRASLCSNFLLLDRYDMDKLLQKKVGEKVTICNKRKNSQHKEYVIMEQREDITAIKNKKDKIKFVTYLHRAENSYDALFDCNKAIYKGWFNKTCIFIK